MEGIHCRQILTLTAAAEGMESLFASYGKEPSTSWKPHYATVGDSDDVSEDDSASKGAEETAKPVENPVPPTSLPVESMGDY